jgi:hypothetical protein
LTSPDLTLAEVCPSLSATGTEPRYAIGSPIIDSTLGGLALQGAYLIEAEAAHLDELVYRMLVEFTGRHTLTPLVIECGSSFNPYRVAEIARTHGYSAGFVLENILIVRPFTAYQLNTLFSERLPELASEADAVIFSHLTHLFRGRDAPLSDALIILDEALRELSALKKEKLLVITARIEDKVKRVVRAKLAGFADTWLSFSMHRDAARVKMHNSCELPPGEMVIPLTQASQLTLEEFLGR